MYMHPTYVVTPEREPLGVTDAWMWAREAKGADGKRAGILESQRWIEGYERVADMAGEMPETRLVYIADREADLVGLMVKAALLGTPADWLIRAKCNRCVAVRPWASLNSYWGRGKGKRGVGFDSRFRRKKIEISGGEAARWR